MIKKKVNVIIPVSLFNKEKKVITRNLHKDGSYNILDLLYVHYDGLKLYVTKVKHNTYQVL